jgi:sec-independent protein translocase protein TatC
VKLRAANRVTSADDGATMTLVDHLRELRTRLVKAAAALVVGMIVMYFLYMPIFRFASKPYCKAVRGSIQANCNLYFHGLLDGFLLRLQVAGYLGFVLALPVIAWQLWRFIAPGLYKKEKRYAVAFVAASTFLFACGAVLAYLTLPPMFNWLIGNGGPGVYQNRADDYFHLMAIMMLAFGISFEFPLLLVVLQLVGVLDNSVLRQYRRHAFVGIVVVVAVVTPGGDPISLFALSIPLYIFYEMSILFGRVMTRRRARA